MAKPKDIADEMLGKPELQLEHRADRIVRSFNSVKYVFSDGSHIVIRGGQQVKGGERA